MNIFVTSMDPDQCARDYCDSHVNKMILETTQLLCTAHHAAGCTFPGIYKPTHMNHPSAIWVRADADNYIWAYRLLRALHREYEYRKGREHGCKALLGSLLWIPKMLCTAAGLDDFIPASDPEPIFVGPETCAPGLPVVERYRELYRIKRQTFKRPMRWTKRPIPSWL